MDIATRNTYAHVSPICGLYQSFSHMNLRSIESVHLLPFTRKGQTSHCTSESEMNTLYLDKRCYQTTKGMLARGHHSQEKETSPFGAVMNDVCAMPKTASQATRSATINVVVYESEPSLLGKGNLVENESKNALGEPLRSSFAFNLEHQVQQPWSKKPDSNFSYTNGARSKTN